MPVESGIQLLENIRKRNSDIPIVLMITGFADLPDGELYEKGAHEILKKPFSMNGLYAVVEKLMLASEEKTKPA